MGRSLTARFTSLRERDRLGGRQARPARGPILTVSHGVELLLRVGQCPNLLLTLGAEIPQMGRRWQLACQASES